MSGPSRGGRAEQAGTCDAQITGQVISIASDDRSYDLLTFVTGCSPSEPSVITPFSLDSLRRCQVCRHRRN
jgi:hypothetical protein